MISHEAFHAHTIYVRPAAPAMPGQPTAQQSQPGTETCHSFHTPMHAWHLYQAPHSIVMILAAQSHSTELVHSPHGSSCHTEPTYTSYTPCSCGLLHSCTNITESSGLHGDNSVILGKAQSITCKQHHLPAAMWSGQAVNAHDARSTIMLYSHCPCGLGHPLALVFHVDTHSASLSLGQAASQPAPSGATCT